jgi:hypothetical protein
VATGMDEEIAPFRDFDESGPDGEILAQFDLKFAL